MLVGRVKNSNCRTLSAAVRGKFPIVAFRIEKRVLNDHAVREIQDALNGTVISVQVALVTRKLANVLDLLVVILRR